MTASQRKVIRLILILWLGTVPLSLAVAQAIRFERLDQSTIEERLHRSPALNEARQREVAQLFRESGCAAQNIQEQEVKRRKFSNILCTLPGETDHTILVTAHFDKVRAGSGIVDNWSGAALLASLRESLAAVSRHHKIVFVSFCCEEEGLVGSHSFVDAISKDQAGDISAVVNMDSLGLSPTKVWTNRADPVLAQLLFTAGKAMELPVSTMNVDKVGSTDSESFANLKVRRITLHSVTQETFGVLHTSSDQFKAIHMDDYYQSYRLIAGYISLLDSTLDQPASAPGATNKKGEPNGSPSH